MTSVTKAMCSADYWTNHRLKSPNSTSKSSHRVATGHKCSKNLHETRIKSDIIKQSLAVEMDSKLEPLSFGSNYVESDWAISRNTIHAAATEVIGSTHCKYQDWFNDNDTHIQALLEKKCHLHRTLLNHPASTSKKDVCSAKSEELYSGNFIKGRTHGSVRRLIGIQFYAQCNETKNYYSVLKTVYGPTTSWSYPDLSTVGNTLINDKEKIPEHLGGQFHSVFTWTSVTNNDVITLLYQVPINNSLAELPSQAEVEKAKRRMSRSKPSASDCIPAEVCAMGGAPLTGKPNELFQSISNQEEILQEFKDTSIVYP